MWSREQARAVGTRVAQARVSTRISQSELARRLVQMGIRRRQSEISRLERGLAGEAEYSSVSLLDAIAQITNCDSCWLISGQAAPTPPDGTRAGTRPGIAEPSIRHSDASAGRCPENTLRHAAMLP